MIDTEETHHISPHRIPAIFMKNNCTNDMPAKQNPNAWPSSTGMTAQDSLRTLHRFFGLFSREI
jgi:hypothetical protein